MKVLVTGATGQLGYDVARVLRARGADVVAPTRQEMPLDAPAACETFVRAVLPDVVVHCAAYTAVDRAEEEEPICHLVNVDATGAIAYTCAEIGAKLIYISTDYVFPGDGDTPYEVDAEVAPKNVYGASKLAGERAVRAALPAHFIVRISWVFGINGKNFIKTMLELAKTHDALTVVDDQIGSPTYTADLAVLIAAMTESDAYGTYHATNEGFCSWYTLAVETFRAAGVAVRVTPVTSEAYPTKAVRPHNSRLSKASLDAAGFARLPAWQDAVRRYLAELDAKA